jgi:hypothetical protein
MASLAHLPTMPMPASAAGHQWVKARTFAILTSNPRGT